MRKKGHNSKIQQHRVMALGTALLLNEIYQPMKFRKISSYSLGVILRTKNAEKGA